MSNGNSISGRKKNTAFDFYETPKWATEKIVERLLMDGVLNKYDNIYECCSGGGAISNILKLYFENVKESDIQTGDFISGNKGIDIYELDDECCDVVFTNPPYDLMTQKEKYGGSMLKEFLRISKDKVVLLLNIYFLSSKERKQLLENSGLKYVYIHSDRVTMFPFGEEEPKNGGTKMFAWMIFEKEYQNEPTIRWI